MTNGINLEQGYDFNDYNIIHQLQFRPWTLPLVFLFLMERGSFALKCNGKKTVADNHAESQGQHEWQEEAKSGLNKDIPTCIWHAALRLGGTFTLRIAVLGLMNHYFCNFSTFFKTLLLLLLLLHYSLWQYKYVKLHYYIKTSNRFLKGHPVSVK